MRWPIFFMAVCVFVAAGCGRGNIAAVSGRVTLDNKPLVRAVVVFLPDNGAKNPGPGSVGKTDEQGQFTLQLMSGNSRGAVVGNHKVTITAYEGDDAVIPSSSGKDNVFRKPLVPRKYNAETELTFEVPVEGTTTAHFDLKSK